jgi:hypothetical protein
MNLKVPKCEIFDRSDFKFKVTSLYLATKSPTQKGFMV